MTTKLESILFEACNTEVKDGWMSIEDPITHHYGREIYCDYRDRLSDQSLIEISDSEDPEQVFNEKISDAELDAAAYERVSPRDLSLSAEDRIYVESHMDEAEEWLNEHVHPFYPLEHFLEQEVCVNVILATKEEVNGDFGEYQGFNYYSNYSGELSTDNALMWLANQYGKGEQLQSALQTLRGADDVLNNRLYFTDAFIESSVNELENFTHCMGALTFLIRMPLRDFLELRKIQSDSVNRTLTITKDVTCGLFAPWVGGGSVLELDLPGDLTVPADMLWSAWIEGANAHGYDPGSVYGLCGSAWRPSYELKREIA